MSEKMLEDFLRPGVQQIRHSIRDIDDSYNNDWDILAELVQNSVDAIRKANINDGEINIKIDSLKKEIYVKDNGIGITPHKLPILIKPFSSDKYQDESVVGEKGVGLTFAMFSCNDFYIKSGNEQGTSLARVRDAFNWKNSSGNEWLNLHTEKVKDCFQGTEVRLNNVNNCPVFQLNFEQLKYVLRTRTSIGNTKCLWEEDIKIKITLYFKDQNGEERIEQIPFQYWLVYEGLTNNDVIDLDEFKEYAKVAERTDRDKRKKLKNKIIYYKGTFTHSDNRKIKFVTCFVPKRKVWNNLSIDNKLFTQDQLDNEEFMNQFSYTKFSDGIYTSVKGMPTGISLDHPTTGYAGYWSNIFILFDDSQLKFDIGRKSIHGSQSKILKHYAGEIFKEYLKYITKYVSGEVKKDTEWEKDDIFADIESMMDLNSPITSFLKNPKDQEASVAGMFFELIGKGIITDIQPLTSGYRNKYDLYAKWGHKKIVIEFKSALKNILRDFNDEQKMFNEIDCIICWNIDELDEEAMNDKGIELDEIEYSRFDDSGYKFPNATHILTLSGLTSPIYIIDLKKIIKN